MANRRKKTQVEFRWGFGNKSQLLLGEGGINAFKQFFFIRANGNYKIVREKRFHFLYFHVVELKYLVKRIKLL